LRPARDLRCGFERESVIRKSYASCWANGESLMAVPLQTSTFFVH
jgi:hypothetical protein